MTTADRYRLTAGKRDACEDLDAWAEAIRIAHRELVCDGELDPSTGPYVRRVIASLTSIEAASAALRARLDELMW